jgi:peptidoglycan/LPS O-acetylase OafA/YrhL
MTPPLSPARFAGLDGLRAVAVALVVVYHLFPQWIFAGGFVGVDVFFVISGFLITQLLLTERDESGRISLRRFWTRRARRLIPALVVLVTVCASLAWMLGGDVLARIGWQILGTVTFSYNWVSLGAGTDYFAASSPELFRNLWSLAVEEQFYVLWPLLLPLVLLLPWVWARAAVAVVAAAGSALWMAQLAGMPGELTRAYFGTDTHSFGILLGIALAFAAHSLLRAPAAGARRTRGRVVTLAVGVAALVGILVVGMLPATGTAETFPGALLAGCLLTVLAIACGVWPGSWFGRAIDVAPLRWIGDRSYGLYLWHWPLLVLLTTAIQGTGPGIGVPVGIGILTLALTVAVAELSYRFIERPVRRYGFRGSAARVRAAIVGEPARRFGALVGVATALLVLGGTTAAIAGAPAETSAEAYVEAGLDALDEEADALTEAPETAPTPTAAPAPVPTPVTGGEITAVGDSVMLASAPALMERYPGIHVDAAVSRSMYAGVGILEQLAAGGQLRPYVVVALGTNGPIERTSLERMTEIVGPDRELILVTAFAPRDWIEGVNTELSAFARDRSEVELADWSSAIGGRVDLLADDHVHPGSAGGHVFADTVAGAVDEAELKRATERYWDEIRAEQARSGVRPIEPQ